MSIKSKRKRRGVKKKIGALIFLAVFVALMLFRPPYVYAADDFSDPLRALFKEIQPGMLHTEVNELLKKYSHGKKRWEIDMHELHDRTDIWSPSTFQDYSENIFLKEGSENYISIDLVLYFLGTKVACISYRYWGEGIREKYQRGDLCHLFGY